MSREKPVNIVIKTSDRDNPWYPFESEEDERAAIAQVAQRYAEGVIRREREERRARLPWWLRWIVR